LGNDKANIKYSVYHLLLFIHVLCHFTLKKKKVSAKNEHECGKIVQTPLHIWI